MTSITDTIKRFIKEHPEHPDSVVFKEMIDEKNNQLRKWRQIGFALQHYGDKESA